MLALRVNGKKAIPFELAGDESTQTQILRILEKLRLIYGRSPIVREFAVGELGRLGNNDQMGQVLALTDLVKRSLVYIKDPRNIEYVVSPVNHIENILRLGYSYGDCDDHALMLNTCLEAVGIESQFVGVKLKSKRFNHVISSAKVGNEWFDIDPCAKFTPQRIFEETLTV